MYAVDVNSLDFINFLSMSHANNEYNKLIILNVTDNAIIADSETPKLPHRTG